MAQSVRRGHRPLPASGGPQPEVLCQGSRRTRTHPRHLCRPSSVTAPQRPPSHPERRAPASGRSQPLPALERGSPPLSSPVTPSLQPPNQYCPQETRTNETRWRQKRDAPRKAHDRGCPGTPRQQRKEQLRACIRTHFLGPTPNRAALQAQDVCKREILVFLQRLCEDAK